MRGEKIVRSTGMARDVGAGIAVGGNRHCIQHHDTEDHACGGAGEVHEDVCVSHQLGDLSGLRLQAAASCTSTLSGGDSPKIGRIKTNGPYQKHIEVTHDTIDTPSLADKDHVNASDVVANGHIDGDNGPRKFKSGTASCLRVHFSHIPSELEIEHEAAASMGDEDEATSDFPSRQYHRSNHHEDVCSSSFSSSIPDVSTTQPPSPLDRKRPRATTPNTDDITRSDRFPVSLQISQDVQQCHPEQPSHMNSEPSVSRKEEESGNDLVNVMVPTFFTTACGRPICIRESRALPSTHFLREIHHAPLSSDSTDECHSCNGNKRSDSSFSSTRLYTNKEWLTLKQTISPDGWDIFSLNSATTGSQHESADSTQTPTGRTVAVPYSGFTDAHGRPFFLSHNQQHHSVGNDESQSIATDMKKTSSRRRQRAFSAPRRI